MDLCTPFLSHTNFPTHPCLSSLSYCLPPSISLSLSLFLSLSLCVCLAYKHCLSLPLTVVLAALEGDITLIIGDTSVIISDIAVIFGSSANLSCPFSNGTDFDIYWTVDGHQYDCDNISDTRDGGISCTNSAPLSQSILSIEDTNSLGAGNHVVQCVLEQTIPDKFKNDSSFRTELNSLTETSRNGTLMIIDPSGECV